jgi:hypothetical protein
MQVVLKVVRNQNMNTCYDVFIIYVVEYKSLYNDNIYFIPHRESTVSSLQRYVSAI